MRRLLICLLLLTGTVGGEEHRPRYHFTPPANWMNDPNGLVYFDGEYHLFYQHNPFGDTWGHMSWGHAVSEDLLHWKDLPVALPEREDLMAFSGSVVVDGGRLAALYTGYRPSDGRQAQYLAYSDDRGRTWNDYERNPVLDIGSTDFRDPKVFRYGDEWRMVIALPTERKVSFYSSNDLKSWTWLSDFGPQGAVGGAWECPDLFPLGEHWVLQVDLDRNAWSGGSGGQYFVGEFDGERFTLLNPLVPALPVEGSVVEVDGFASTREERKEVFSSPFVLEKDWLNFRLRGGRHPGSVTVSLLVDGETVAETSGYNGSIFQPIAWDVSEWRGRSAQLRFRDSSTALWGWLEADDFRLAPRPAPLSLERARWVDYGPDYYACLSFNNVPDRRVWLAWMNNWLYGEAIPTSPWRSAMSIPREVSLRRMGDGMVLCQTPLKELESLRAEPREASSLPRRWILGTGSGEIILRVERGRARRLWWEMMDLRYEVDFEERTLTMRRKGNFHPDFPLETRAPLFLEDGTFEARLLFDQSSVELFTDGGAVCVTARTFPNQIGDCVFGSDGELGAASLKSWTLRPSMAR